MSENQLQIDSQIQEKRDSLLDNNLAEQVISNSVFRLMLKDIVEGLFEIKANQNKKDQGEPRISVESFVEEIGDSLVLIAQNQANKKIKQAEKFLNQMYELKVKEITDRFEGIVENKLKQVDNKLKQIEQRTRNQSCFLSPVKPKLKNPQLMETSVSDQFNKRMELKQKILNSSFIPEARYSANMESISMLSESLNDISFQKLSQKIKSIEQTFKQEIKLQNVKFNAIRAQVKSDLSECQSGIKQQMNAGFEGLWNVITNLEKRMF